MLELGACAIFFLVADQWSKHWMRPLVRSRSAPRRGGPIIPLVALWSLALVSAVLLARSGIWFRTSAAQFGLAAAFGGAAGNLLDTIQRRPIVDFIDLRWWPAFNVADVAIVGGLVVAFSLT